MSTFGYENGQMNIRSTRRLPGLRDLGKTGRNILQPLNSSPSRLGATMDQLSRKKIGSSASKPQVLIYIKYISAL